MSLTVMAVFVLAGCSRNDSAGEPVAETTQVEAAPAPKDPNYQEVSRDDNEINAAREKARSTTNDFVLAFKAQKPGTTNFFVKKAFPNPAGGEEHIWIRVTEEKEGVLTGTIANNPQNTLDLSKGDPATVNLSEITDWKYQDGTKLVGGYTIRHFINKMPPAEREAFLKKAGFELE
jgi:uncharacterized protein YegJ (DUF2314 family)